MGLYEDVSSRAAKVAVVGMGYVGAPLAAAFSQKADVIGYDNNAEKIGQYIAGVDPTREIGDEALSRCPIDFTCDEKRLGEARFVIVAVPTPIKEDKSPDLRPLLGACETVGRNLRRDALVVFESTVYPGVTEEICVPVLERASGLRCGRDFFVGYSPERINPGDTVHRLRDIVKIVAAMDAANLEELARLYAMVVDAGIHRAPSIKVAEAAKVAENSQRDINIAFMNELSIAFDRMAIDTQDVLDAMNTKWNALGFTPGLVGGHCIGVDPYYFIYEAERLGYRAQIMSASRYVNDGMSIFITDKILRQMIRTNKVIRQTRVAILGVTFKEDVPDTRNSKVRDIVRSLRDYGLEPLIVDPVADQAEIRALYGPVVRTLDEVQDMDCVVLAVAHDAFRKLRPGQIDRMFRRELPDGEKIFIDIKSVFNKASFDGRQYAHWRL